MNVQFCKFDHMIDQHFPNFCMLQHTNTFWIWLRHTYFMKSKTNFSQTLQRELRITRFCQNIKLSWHTSASLAAHQCAAAHSLGNTLSGRKWSRLVSLIRDKAQHLSKHNKQWQLIWETLINLATCSPKTLIENCDKFQKKIIISNPNLVKQKWWRPNPSTYWTVARYQPKSKCMFISGHFHLLGMCKTRKYISCVCDQKSRAASAQSFTLWQPWGPQKFFQGWQRQHFAYLFLIVADAT